MQDIVTGRKKATIVIVDDEQSILKELKLSLIHISEPTRPY